MKIYMVHSEKSAEEDWGVEGVSNSPVSEGVSIYPQKESSEREGKSNEIKTIPNV